MCRTTCDYHVHHDDDEDAIVLNVCVHVLGPRVKMAAPMSATGGRIRSLCMTVYYESDEEDM